MKNPALQSASSNLSSQINKAIGYRILFCFLLAIAVVFLFSFNEITSSTQQLKKSVEEQCNNLRNFIISRALVDNEEAIQPKLDVLSQNSSGTKFYWDSGNKKQLHAEFHWRFPLSWSYSYPVQNIDDTELGTLIVSDSLLTDHAIFSGLITRLGLLLLFFVSIFIVLNPLSKRIPQRLFIAPVNNLVSLLRDGKSTADSEYTSAFPQEINEIRTKITDLLKDAEARSRQAALGQIATQVAHDIRSPLEVLKHILKDISSLPEKKHIDARHAIQRVTDIANNLLTQYKYEKLPIGSEPGLSFEPAAIMLESIVSEKRIQIADIDIDIILNVSPNAHHAFVQVDIAIFKRVLSNLIDNSIEAVKDKKGLITLILQKNDRKVFITVKDNGCGIPQDKLLTVLKEGSSFGKKKGSGLGLTYAINKISEWCGDYSLTSQPGEGTEFEIVLPETQPAEWFRSEINLQEGSLIIVLDDDDYIHQIWDERFPKSFLDTHAIKIFHFYNPQDFVDFCRGRIFEKTIFFLDYELGQYKETGLSLAKMLNIYQHAVLVTSRYEDADVREQCVTLGMKIIPRSFVELTPIHVFTPSDIVFIDDEVMLTDYWKESAKLAGKQIDTYNDPREFMDMLHMYPKKTLIYMDSSLNGLKGEDFIKLLYWQGYQNIILATGYPKEHFKGLALVKDIVGKDPPWGYIN